jgi:hypothetical protein
MHQALDDATGSVQRSVVTGLGGERGFHWANAGLVQRYSS